VKIEELQKEIIDFRDNRNWEQFHKIKDIDIERIEEEVSDIFIFLTYICNHFNIDLSGAVKNKIELNNRKYPIDKSYNSNKKYTEL
jgi:NTP pyrophosphatase (non-canonical NTP hydrolase)